MTDRHTDYARTSHAMLKAMGALQTWAQIQDGTDALQHVQLRFRLLDLEMQRHEQEQGSCGMPSPKNPQEGSDGS